jgi:hypothetical protein
MPSLMLLIQLSTSRRRQSRPNRKASSRASSVRAAVPLPRPSPRRQATVLLLPLLCNFLFSANVAIADLRQLAKKPESETSSVSLDAFRPDGDTDDFFADVPSTPSKPAQPIKLQACSCCRFSSCRVWAHRILYTVIYQRIRVALTNSGG